MPAWAGQQQHGDAPAPAGDPSEQVTWALAGQSESGK